MKLGIIGLPQSGKSTLFAALSGTRGQGGLQKPSRSEQHLATIKVADERVDFLSAMYKPKKTTYARLEYLLPGQPTSALPGKAENQAFTQARVCDALLHVVRNFEGPGGVPPSPETDFRKSEEEMILSDLVVAEKRIERIDLDAKRGKKPDEEELSLIRASREMLERGLPLRLRPEIAEAQALRGFTFLSAKPQLVIINNGDEDESMPEWKQKPEHVETLVVRARLEQDIASMPSEEAREFMEAYHIDSFVLDRAIQSSYRLLNLISFFTVLNDEVRAWTIKQGLPALEAAGTVHTDMKKGFIRTEVLSFDDLNTLGSFHEAKQKGVVRLEGKEYVVKDGDIINFRFNI
ncbi:MAG: redox-regulated ATPase YchF [Deltaproteobacteria bacterium]|nr:redox-regulated ATPase YchF [Deltaproteobacteria bacterium]